MSWASAGAVVLFVSAIAAGALLSVRIDRRRQSGTGLGLSIARAIIANYGGRIWAENKRSGGAVFRFILPLAKARTAAIATT